MATQAIKRRARRRLFIAFGTGAALLLVGLLLIVAIFGGISAFSGDEDGSTAEDPSAGRGPSSQCAGAGGPLAISGLPGGTTVGALSAAATANAAVITQVAWSKGLGDDAAVIGIIVGMAESGLQNYANDGTSSLRDAVLKRQLNASERSVAKQSMQYPHDVVGSNLDSIGLFQQRPMTGWGDPKDLIDPSASSGKFYDALVSVAPGWKNMDPWRAAQIVQGSPSSDGGIYREKYPEAQATLEALKPLIPDETDAAVTAALSSRSSSSAAPSTTRSTTSSQPVTISGTNLAAADPGSCQGGGGGGAGDPVVFDGQITITAPSGTYTVKLPAGARGVFIQRVATKMATQYVWGAAGPDVFDCSGLMSWGLTEAAVGVGRLTADGFWQSMPHIAAGSEQPGDIALFGARFGNSGRRAGHIGVVIDAQQKLMMHTYSSGAPATISRYDTWSGDGPIGFAQVVPAGAGESSGEAPTSEESASTNAPGYLAAK